MKSMLVIRDVFLLNINPLLSNSLVCHFQQ